VSSIEFDIAVTASASTQGDLQGGITVFSVNLGGRKEEKEQQETVSRLKFELDLVLPYETTESAPIAIA
jgi:hypothetical protein